MSAAGSALLRKPISVARTYTRGGRQMNESVNNIWRRGNNLPQQGLRSLVPRCQHIASSTRGLPGLQYLSLLKYGTHATASIQERFPDLTRSQDAQPSCRRLRGSDFSSTSSHLRGIRAVQPACSQLSTGHVTLVLLVAGRTGP